MRRWLVVALVLAGCSTDKYWPPPADAVASCKLTEKQQGTVTQQQALWFDSSNRLVQTDGYDYSTTYAYDDQGRLQSANTPRGTTIWTYDPTQITETTTNDGTFVFTLDANGRVLHYEDRDTSASPVGLKSDYQYDANGRITSRSGQTPYALSPDGPTMLHVYSFQYTYDDQGRIASAASGSMPPTTYAYTETPGHLTVGLSGTENGAYEFDFDSDGRVVRAAANGFNQTYTYDGDSITMVTNVGYELDATGTCTGPAATFGPEAPLPIRLDGDVVRFLDPPADDFSQTYD